LKEVHSADSKQKEVAFMVNPDASVVVAPSLPNQVYSLIKSSILSGTYKPHQNLNEVEISQLLQISRSPVREAIQMLANDGLVKIIHRRGAFVSSLTIEEVEELCELRHALEILSVRAAVNRATPEDIQKVSQCLRDTETAIEENNYTYYPLDFDFHLRIAMSAKNSKLEETIHKVNGQLALARYQSGSQDGRPVHALEEHSEIFEALTKRHTVIAENLMAQHLAKSRENMLNTLK
jgi:DNA-binding GntR family transcriptional regulator